MFSVLRRNLSFKDYWKLLKDMMYKPIQKWTWIIDSIYIYKKSNQYNLWGGGSKDAICWKHGKIYKKVVKKRSNFGHK
jgi:hypothetical protein